MKKANPQGLAFCLEEKLESRKMRRPLEKGQAEGQG